ncbi:hypothetical protein DNTS_031503 [Danionella cerebrum]|uniref:Band 3 cytoplasmic domain-containing protein n=1 Tax=Danionella cerebrum TaxID=2873325 RepID=A0A553QDX6_9TELE|nr:hypothetical protein DNTS_031503 [Danionella translucida]
MDLFCLYFQRHDEEAVLDRGGTRSMLNTNFEKEELEGHRTLYIGVHVPLGRRSHRRHRHHGHRHRKRSRDRDSGTEDGRESPSYTDTPSQRVQFLLGMEDDEEHIPHALFTELDEICLKEGEDAEWKETARWLKFEEDVEDGGERWSKPYVATLSLHSLFELRSCILNGTVMLDMRANSLEEIADMVLDQHETLGSLGEEVRKKIRNALLKQHHHQNQKKLANRIPIVRSFADIGKKQSEPHSMDKNVTVTSHPPCTPRSSLWSRFSRSMRDRQVLLCPDWSHCCPKRVPSPQKHHHCPSASSFANNPLITLQKSHFPFNNRQSPLHGYQIIPTLSLEDERPSGNMIVD